MPPPINPLNPPPQDERNLRKLVTEGLAPGEELQLGNTLRRGGKRGPAGAQATFRGKIRPDQPGLRYNLLLIDDAERGAPRFVNLDTLRYVMAKNRMSRPWGDPKASHDTIPREERRYAKDATYTTSGGNTGVRHFYPPGYGPLDDEDAPESRRPPEPISELRGPAGRERFNRWLSAGGVGQRTRDFSEGENMEGLGFHFAAPDRGMLNDGGPWAHGRFAPKGFAGRMADSLGVSLVPLGQQQQPEMQGGGMSYARGAQDFAAGAADRSAGAINHFMPGLRRMGRGRGQGFSLGGQSFGIRSIPPTASAYLDRMKAWQTPGGDVEPPDMPAREEADSTYVFPHGTANARVLVRKADLGAGWLSPDAAAHADARLGRVSHGGLDYDPSEMSDRVPTDEEKRQIVGGNLMDTRLGRAMKNGRSMAATGGPLQDYELEREEQPEQQRGKRGPSPWAALGTSTPRGMLERHNLRYPNTPATQEPRVSVPGSSNDIRTRLLEMELNDPSVPHDELAGLKGANYLGGSPLDSNGAAHYAGDHRARELWYLANHKGSSLPVNGGQLQLEKALGRNIARHNFSRGSQDFAIQPQRSGALGNASLVPILLPQGSAPALGVTPTGGFAPPPRNAALVPQRRFALGEDEMNTGMLGGDQQFRVGDRPNYAGGETADFPSGPRPVQGGRSMMPRSRSYGISSTDYDPAGQADRLNTAQFPLGDRMKSRAIGQIAPIKPSYQPQDMARQLNRAAVPRDRVGNVARPQQGGERSWGDWWQGLNNKTEDWLRSVGGQRLRGGAIAGAGAGAMVGGIPGAIIGTGLGALAGGAKGVYDWMNSPRRGVNPQRVSGAAYNRGDRAFMRSVRRTPQFSLSSQDFSREDDFGDLLAQLGLGSDIPPVADEPMMVAPQTPEEMMRARATINTAHGPRDLYDLDPEKISGYLRGQGVMTGHKPTQKRLRAVYGASGRIEQPRGNEIANAPQETGLAGRVAEITGGLPMQQPQAESPEVRRRRVSGRELGSFSLGEQDFGLRDILQSVNPVSNYRHLRNAGYGRLASGAMVGGGLVGDAALTGFHPPLVSLALGRYAQGAAKRNEPERDRAEWMRG